MLDRVDIRPRDESLSSESGLRSHRQTDKGSDDRAQAVRLALLAGVGTALTAIFLGWLWGTLRIQDPVLASLTENATRVTHSLLEQQAENLSR